MMIAIVLILLLPTRALGLVGYDCGGPNLNISTVSLIDVGDCDIPDVNPNTTSPYIQLLQLAKYEHSMVTQCSVKIHRNIFYCGMHSHLSGVPNGVAQYISEVSQDSCKEMHRTGIFYYNRENQVSGIKPNSTTTASITLAGKIQPGGYCEGTQYADPYGSWDDVVVQAAVTISLRTYRASVNLENNKLYLRSGTTCTYSDEACVDVDGGHTFWTTLPQENCRFNQYDVLYEGIGNKIEDPTSNDKIIMYTVTAGDVTFALTKRGEQHLCGYTMIKTEHPKLIIVETRREEAVPARRKLAVENLDMFAYVNSKFVYVERHVRTQMNQLYKDILVQRCELEKQVLRNSLTTATSSPDEFAYHLMKGPGYMALSAGEVVHIVKCIPVEVRVLRTRECYNQLPVEKGNETMFLSPRTHVLVRTGTQVNCNEFLPPMYFLIDGWYKLLPNPVKSIPPTVMEPLTKPTWKYTNPGELATSGIYASEDLENLRERIMFPVERPSVLHTIARGANGQPTVRQGLSMLNLLDEKALENIAKTTWSKIWSSFTSFGSIAAGGIGIYFIFQLIKLIIDTLVHGYALHTVYGWSIHLIGALWASVASLLIHLGRTPREGRRTPDEDEELASAPPSLITKEPDVSSVTVYQPVVDSIEDLQKRLAARQMPNTRLTFETEGGGVTSRDHKTPPHQY
ncbi:uncharacterized protein LOC125501329 [Athalia rosae]|uniref:uncharacterized protein LOC125501329 n=1 Tax=Athalia rosae TaxID=37344 RepID=UPI0020341C92|nr:uncharacterized protein LOC125501329 [Athalia rosae]